MLCEKCQLRPATVRIRRTVNNETNEQHLCQECAQDSGELAAVTGSEFSLPTFFASLLDAEKPGSEAALTTGTTKPCTACGLTYPEFRQVGRLGCGQCYRDFSEQLEPLLRRIHGRTEHGGEFPAGLRQQAHVSQKLEQLRAELKECVQREEFEKAAELRDHIRALEKELQQGGEGA